jgi:hypothetical protein
MSIKILFFYFSLAMAQLGLASCNRCENKLYENLPPLNHSFSHGKIFVPEGYFKQYVLNNKQDLRWLLNNRITLDDVNEILIDEFPNSERQDNIRICDLVYAVIAEEYNYPIMRMPQYHREYEMEPQIIQYIDYKNLLTKIAFDDLAKGVLN